MTGAGRSGERASASLSASAAAVYAYLTNYDSYSSWLPGLSRSVLLAREGDLALAELTGVISEGQRCTVECIHTPLQSIQNRRISGEFPILQWKWELRDAANGSCEVQLEVETGRRRWPLFGRRGRRLAEPAAWLAGLGDWCRLQQERQLLLALRRSTSGLELDLGGRRYRLLPLAEPAPGDSRR